MKPIKMNTYPSGSIGLYLFLSLYALWLLPLIFLLPYPAGIPMLLVSLGIFIPALLCAIKEYHNYIYMTRDSVWHGDEKYAWEEVCITAYFRPCGRNDMRCFLYFDDRYLTAQACRSKKILKKRFYMVFTPQRLAQLSQFYGKPIFLENEISFGQGKRICAQIRAYNLRCDIEASLPDETGRENEKG